MTVSPGLVRTKSCAKRVRIYLGGQLTADTPAPLLVWEIPYHPTYYFPVEDVHAELLVSDGQVRHSPSRGNGSLFTVRCGTWCPRYKEVARTGEFSAVTFSSGPTAPSRCGPRRGRGRQTGPTPRPPG